ncbi:MAG: TRAP transporter large permease [Pseudomonadota bacterium]
MFTTSLLGVLGFSLVTGAMVGGILAAVGLLILTFFFSGNYSVIANSLWGITTNYSLTAIPMFIFMGEILGATGVATRIYDAFAPLFQRLPGGLVQSNIGTCATFSAISGSSTATTAVVGSIAFDELMQRGYDRSLVAGSIAGGGTLGMLIPPSIILIFYGSLTDVSVGKLFIAGVVPGLLVACLFMAYIAFVAKTKPEKTPRDTEIMPLGKALIHSLAGWPFVLLVLAILGSMFAGVATATEAAGLGVVTSIILATLYGEMTLARFFSAVRSTAIVFSGLGVLLLGGVTLAQAVSLSGLPDIVLTAMQNANMSPVIAIAMVYLLYLVLGCVFGAIEMLLITLPFTFPLMTALGFDPLWLGVALVILIEIGLLTPPLGLNLFMVMGMSKGELSLGQAARAALPYWLILLSFLILITWFEGIVLFLPNLVA